MGLKVSCIDHDAFMLWPVAGKTCKDAIKNAEQRPADEAVVDRLVRPIGLRCVFPLQAIADDIDDAANNAASSTRGTRAKVENTVKSAPSAPYSTETAHSSQPPSIETLNQILN
jgi:hypothetical protein